MGIVGVERDVVQPTVAPGWIGGQLNVLAIVDLDEGDALGPVLTLERKRFVEAEEVLVEGARPGEVAHVQSRVSDAEDSRALDALALQSRRGSDQKRRQ